MNITTLTDVFEGPVGSEPPGPHRLVAEVTFGLLIFVLVTSLVAALAMTAQRTGAPERPLTNL